MTVVQRVYDALEQHGPLTARHVAGLIGEEPATVSNGMGRHRRSFQTVGRAEAPDRVGARTVWIWAAIPGQRPADSRRGRPKGQLAVGYIERRLQEIEQRQRYLRRITR